MLRQLYVILIQLSVLTFSICPVYVSSAFGQVLKSADLVQSQDGIPGECASKTLISVTKSIDFIATVDVSVRRNGFLAIANLRLRIIDEYDDGQLYLNGMLHVEFKDISGSGVKDLIITGTVIHTGEKDNDPRSYETVTSVYTFDIRSKTFRLAFHVGPTLEI